MLQLGLSLTYPRKGVQSSRTTHGLDAGLLALDLAALVCAVSSYTPGRELLGWEPAAHSVVRLRTVLLGWNISRS